ncbi:ECF RNA polymerase sigma factor SigK [Arthrobacter castelli]|uniref:ECF RNA polymerase sigma factor SigK n=1 Tax=Arthrobacter castelli TaxID=271431 RepID=UPI0003F8C476|nr:ECF RNA polymerase sigma factor SigK [Arthrobacter castelli]
MDFSGYDRPGQSVPGGMEGQSSAKRGSDEDLVQLLFEAGQGNQESFALFYDHTVRRVFGLAQRILIDTELSEDATQEVYLQVWKAAGQYVRAAGTPMAWLMTIGHRRAVDKVRSQQRSSDREARYTAVSGDVERDDVVDSVTGRLEAEAVVECLDTLTGRQQESVKLAYYGGLTYRQVAEKLGAAVPTIKSRIRDGLLRLKDCLEVS